MVPVLNHRLSLFVDGIGPPLQSHLKDSFRLGDLTCEFLGFLDRVTHGFFEKHIATASQAIRSDRVMEVQRNGK